MRLALRDRHLLPTPFFECGGDRVGDEPSEGVRGDVVNDRGVLGDDLSSLAVTDQRPHDMDVVAA